MVLAGHFEAGFGAIGLEDLMPALFQGGAEHVAGLGGLFDYEDACARGQLSTSMCSFAWWMQRGPRERLRDRLSGFWCGGRNSRKARTQPAQGGKTPQPGQG